jgi:hypothetical protein
MNHISIAVAVLASLAQNDAAELGQAAAKAAEWTSYDYSITETVEGGRSGADPIQGTYEKGKGLYSKEDSGQRVREEVFVDGKRANSRRDGTWRARLTTDRIEPPHQVLEHLEKNFKSVTKSTEAGSTVFSGEPTKAGQSWLLGSLLRRVTGQGDTRTTGKVFLEFDGNIAKVEIQGVFEGKNNGQDVKVTATKVLAFSKINEAKLEIPAEAAAALENPEPPGGGGGGGIMGRLTRDLGLTPEQTTKFQNELNALRQKAAEIYQGAASGGPDAIREAMGQIQKEFDATTYRLKEGLTPERQQRLDGILDSLRRQFGLPGRGGQTPPPPQQPPQQQTPPSGP